MENTKPRLFIFGDSFAQWPKPEKEYRWPTLMEEHYEVHNFAIPGTDNSHIIYQFANLPEYRRGDRIVIVLTEVSRIPKWMWGDTYEKFLSYRNKKHTLRNFNKTDPDLKYVESLVDLRLLMVNLIENTDLTLPEYKKFKSNQIDNPLQVYQYFSNIPTLFKNYKPVMVTWDKRTKDILPNHVKLIGWDEYEHIHVPKDDHPSILGNKVWYDKIYKWLQDDFIVEPPYLPLNV